MIKRASFCFTGTRKAAGRYGAPHVVLVVLLVRGTSAAGASGTEEIAPLTLDQTYSTTDARAVPL
jgi:hypothetical protein